LYKNDLNAYLAA